MSVEHIELLVEEPSMEAAMRELLPRLLGGVSFKVYAHQCKEELLARLPDRLRGYKRWLPETWRIVVLVDRDDDDCRELKNRMEQIADHAGLISRSIANGSLYSIVNRLAIEELESWYFGDWSAVSAAYPRASRDVSHRAQFRDPDAIRGGTWEAFERVMQRIGYFKGGLRKIEAARSIAEHWDPIRNQSASFCAFRDVMLEMTI
jgi:hypothetical protein